MHYICIEEFYKVISKLVSQHNSQNFYTDLYQSTIQTIIPNVNQICLTTVLLCYSHYCLNLTSVSKILLKNPEKSNEKLYLILFALTKVM